MPAASAAERSQLGKLGAHISWANTSDRSARTAPARAALDQKFLDAAGGDPVRGAHLRKAHFARLALNPDPPIGDGIRRAVNVQMPFVR